MKKVLSVLSLVALLGLATPANAVPPPPHAGGPMGRGEIVHAGSGFHGHGNPRRYDWGAPPPPRAYYGRGSVVVGGVLARRSYWGYPYGYDCRLGWCEGYYPPPCPPVSYRPNVYIDFGIPIRF